MVATREQREIIQRVVHALTPAQRQALIAALKKHLGRA